MPQSQHPAKMWISATNRLVNRVRHDVEVKQRIENVFINDMLKDRGVYLLQECR